MRFKSPNTLFEEKGILQKKETVSFMPFVFACLPSLSLSLFTFFLTHMQQLPFVCLPDCLSLPLLVCLSACLSLCLSCLLHFSFCLFCVHSLLPLLLHYVSAFVWAESLQFSQHPWGAAIVRHAKFRCLGPLFTVRSTNCQQFS